LQGVGSNPPPVKKHAFKNLRSSADWQIQKEVINRNYLLYFVCSDDKVEPVKPFRYTPDFERPYAVVWKSLRELQ